MLLLLGGICWYYWSDSDYIPGTSSIINGIKSTKYAIDEMLGLKNTVKNSKTTVIDLLRKDENKTFEKESQSILDSIMHAVRIVPVERNIKEEYNKYLIVKTRIEQLKEKFPEKFNNWIETRAEAKILYIDI
jgi:signal transduction protein with GAF and PtsI domain